MLHAYDPMLNPRKEVSEDRMREILEKRCREAGHVRIDPPDPAREGPTDKDIARPPERVPTVLVWQQPVRTTKDGQGYQRAVGNRYVVSKVRVMEKFRYTASLCHADESPATPLGSYDTAEEARARCESEALR